MPEDSTAKLAALFREALAPSAREATPPGAALGESLSEAVRSARAEWPELEVPDEIFVAFLAVRVPDHEDVGTALGTMQVGDLYLACACLRGESAAIAAFERRFGSELDIALRQIDLPPAQREEVRQSFQARLLVAPAGAQGTLAKYSGRGSLSGWLRVSITRLALRQAGRGRRERAVSDDLLENLPEAENDPELGYLKDLYRVEFKAAFEVAMERLTTRERNLLRHQFVDRLNIDEIGALYRVHRSTAARWLDKARQSVVDHIRRSMMERLRIQGDEYESIMRLIRSQVDLSITRHLEPVPLPEED